MSQLVTLDEYKTYATIKSVEFDARIEQIITSVSYLVENYCSRTLLLGDPLVDYDNGGSTIIYTEQFPIVAITSVELTEDYGQTYTPLSEYSGYIIDKKRDAIISLIEDGVEHPNKYKVTYTAGYEVLPEDLKLAIFDLIDYYYKNESVPKRMSNFVTIEYVKTTDFPPHIKRVLDLYRSI